MKIKWIIITMSAVDVYNKLFQGIFLGKVIEVQILMLHENLTKEFTSLPLNKVNFSLSEIMNIEDTIYYTNVINSKKPYIIVSYYKKNGRIVMLDKLKEEFLINALNIYFNKRAFYRYSDIEKVY
ncbi:hypothetical protein LFU01_17230 [Lysinibacillus fusiformis]|nr:hypothetical protein C7B90_22315 [Lysinibacillus fusiformis]GED63271.1 hypothetical protein LFU01_17230 [Lysinibacillus fusiformis]